MSHPLTLARRDAETSHGSLPSSASTEASRLPALWLAAAVVVLPAVAGAQSWPQWRGPERSGIAADFEPPGQWPQVLRKEWSSQVGPGASSPVVAEGRVFAFVRDEGGESLMALRLSDGEVLWKKSYRAPFKPVAMVKRHDKGPFSTPAVRDGRVFSYGIREVLTAWSAESGEVLWRKDFGQEFEKPQPFYGTAQSPLVLADRVVVHVGGPGGGALVALAVADGSELWRSPTDDGPSYGSPVRVELDGVAQVVTLTQRHFAGFDAASGMTLWDTPFRVTFDTGSVTPVLYGDLLILSAGQRPTRAFRPRRSPSGWTVGEAWSTDEFQMQYSSPVIVGDRLFGFSVRNKGQLVCADAKSGAVLWLGPPRQGENSFLVAAGQVVLSFGEDAELEIVDAQANEHRVLARYSIGDSWMWSHPAVFGQSILVKDYDHLHLWSVIPDTQNQ